jgi:hypothetical protein
MYFLSDETPKEKIPYCPLDVQKDLYPFDGCECEIIDRHEEVVYIQFEKSNRHVYGVDECSLIPFSELKRDFLIYGKKYKCFRNRKYVGDFIYTDDSNVGDSFLKESKTTEGEDCYEVCIPHEWQFV